MESTPKEDTTEKDFEKQWFDFCEFGGLHCTEEAQVMRQAFEKREKEAYRLGKAHLLADIDGIKDGHEFRGVDYISFDAIKKL